MLHRHARPAVAGSYLLGTVTGAALSASLLLVVGGLASPLPRSLRDGVTLAALAILGLRLLGVVTLNLPQRRYQIPRDVFGPRPTRSAFRFAFELGTGVRTYVTASAPYALAVLLILHQPVGLARSAAAAAAAAVGFGTGRSVVVVSQTVRRAVAVDHPGVWLRAADGVALAAAAAVVFAR